MSKYLDDNNNIVTIFNRKKLRPAIDETSRPLEAKGSIPRKVFFVMPDGSEASVGTDKEIVVGRQARPDDPPVTLDLENFDGHELGVSRQHCMMKVFNDKLMLVDLDSINGTFVNGKRAKPLQRYQLMDGDTITIGRLSVELRFARKNK
jgi:pSer/pThr/pTyr-binding forkhead associated (FHA) protein